MTERWVSRQMHYCEYCRVFMQPDKATIARHENGANHKANVEKKLSEKKQQAEKEEREYMQAKQEMASLEARAQQAYKKDNLQRPEDKGEAVGEEAKLKRRPKTTASVPTYDPREYEGTAYALGFGTNHPKYEAAKAKSSLARSHVEQSMGGSSLTGGKRKREDSGSRRGRDTAEVEAQARREAARRRVQQRSMEYMGLR